MKCKKCQKEIESAPKCPHCGEPAEILSKKVIGYKDLGIADKDTAWDGPAQVKDADVETLKLICTWYDSEKPDVKASYKLPHHMADTKKAVWNGVKSAMAVLNGGMGGVDIPDADRDGVYSHLKSHYGQFDETAPELKSKQVEKDEPIKKFVKIDKRDDDKQLVYGVVYEPDVVDAQGDYAEKDEIEKACHNYMENYQNVSWMHKELINEDAKIVECYIAQADFDLGERKVKKGAWVLVVHVLNKEIWDEIKKGAITGYSLEGTATSKTLSKSVDVDGNDDVNKGKPRKLTNLNVTAVALVDSPANKLSFNLIKRDVGELWSIADLAGCLGSLKSMLERVKNDGKIDDPIIKELLAEISGIPESLVEKKEKGLGCLVPIRKSLDYIKTNMDIVAKKFGDEIAKRDGIIVSHEKTIREMSETMQEVAKKIPTAESIKKMFDTFSKLSNRELEKIIKSQN